MVPEGLDRLAALELAPDRESELPLGVQLGWKLRALIEAGALAAGERLPAVRELAASAAVNVNTVRGVYARLEAQGLVTTQQGRGTFVAAREPIGEEIGRIAARAALDARSAGIDPREVAATLYVGADSKPQRRAPRAASERERHTEPPEDAARRRELRLEIAQLEQELVLVAHLDVEDEASRSSKRSAGRLQSADELELTRDQLRSRLAALTDRRQRSRAAAAERRMPSEDSATGPASRGRRTQPAHGWKLRWDVTGSRLLWTGRYGG
jgi:DNA-binding transcriptional regulator YhcF (GntR family)